MNKLKVLATFSGWRSLEILPHQYPIPSKLNGIIIDIESRFSMISFENGRFHEIDSKFFFKYIWIVTHLRYFGCGVVSVAVKKISRSNKTDALDRKIDFEKYRLFYLLMQTFGLFAILKVIVSVINSKKSNCTNERTLSITYNKDTKMKRNYFNL